MPSTPSNSLHNNQFITGNGEIASLPRKWITRELHRVAHELPPPGNFRQMLYLQSPPGYGKTSFMKSIVHDLNTNDPLLKDKIVLLETVLAAHETPSDIMGISFPVIAPGMGANRESSTRSGAGKLESKAGVSAIGDESLPVRHTVQTWTPVLRQIDDAVSNGKIVVWFFDELNNINAQWEAAILKLSEGKFKEWELPDRFILVGAGNPPEQSIHKSGFGESLKSRLYMVQFIPDYDQWRAHMLAEGQRPENYVARFLVADFVGTNRNYFLASPSVKRGSRQLGHIATNPRSWTLTADALARLFRYNVSPPTLEQVQWVVERRIPASIASEFTRFFSSYANFKILPGQSSRSSVFIPAQSSSQFRLPDIPVPTPAIGDGQNGQDEDWARYKRAIAAQQEMEQKVQRCVDGYFAEEIRQHDIVYNNVLSYLMDSLEQPSSFRPIPYLVSKPGVGKTSFVSEIIKTANSLVAEQRQKLTSGAEPVSSEARNRLKDFVLLELVLPSIPSVSDVTGAVLPLPTDDSNYKSKGKEAEKDTAYTPQFRVHSPGNENLPQYHSVTAWTGFIREVDKLARQGKQVVVFCDELSNISPEWEAVFLKMVEGRIGTWHLPPSVLFLAAGNFPHQSAFSRKFKEPMQARLEFMEYTPHFGKWAAHMLRPDLSRNDYLARFATVDFLCDNPHLFNPPEDQSTAGEKQLKNLAPREWTLSTKWMGRMSNYFMHFIHKKEMEVYLAPRLSLPVAQKLASHIESNPTLLEKAGNIWNIHLHDRQLATGIVRQPEQKSFLSALTCPAARHEPLHQSQSRNFDDLYTRSIKVAEQISTIEDALAKDGSNWAERYAFLRKDQESHTYMKDAVKAYLLEPPPPEGEFCDIIYLESPPGYGKTSFCKGIIRELNESLQEEKFKLIEINLSTCLVSEITGISFPVSPDDSNDREAVEKPESGVRSPGNEMLPCRDMVTTWTSFTRSINQCLEEGKIPVVFIDEMSNITQQWEAALLKLSESKIGNNWKVNGPIRFIAAGNPPEDSRAGRFFKDAFNSRLYRMIFRPSFIDYTQRLNRMLPTCDVFHEFASQTVINYLLLYPDQFVPPHGKLTSRNRALCPRNWVNATSQYATLLREAAHNNHIPEALLKTPDTLRAVMVNQSELETVLAPLLPPHTVNAFVAFATLNPIVTGDEIILKGKSIPFDLTSEQVKVVLHSTISSLSRHITVAQQKAQMLSPETNSRTRTRTSNSIYPRDAEGSLKTIDHGQENDKRLAECMSTYLTNFTNFLDTIRNNNHLSSRQQLDSLMMPYIDELQQVVSSVTRMVERVPLIVDSLSPCVKSNFEKTSTTLFDLYTYIYNSLHQNDSIKPTSSTSSGSLATPTASPLLTTPSRHHPHRRLSAGGVS